MTGTLKAGLLAEKELVISSPIDVRGKEALETTLSEIQFNFLTTAKL